MLTKLQTLFEQLPNRANIMVLTGAGISAESGIPTFRGEEGYWVVNSKEYRPTELARQSAFWGAPQSIWEWYLYRRFICNSAQPNTAHYDLVTLAGRLGDRFHLITQNVDGLHTRAGNQTLEVHGNINKMRCSAQCTDDVVLIPDDLYITNKHQKLNPTQLKQLQCVDCHGWMRPHILWFDEQYDEKWYHFDTALNLAKQADLLISVGTSLSVTLPLIIADLFQSQGKPIIDINPIQTPLSKEIPDTLWLQGRASKWLPEVVALF